MSEEKRWWISWWHDESMGEFELYRPWWTSGCGQEGESICAAVIAQTRDDAVRVVINSYDNPPEDPVFRFVKERDSNWCPWIIPEGTSRFQKADWMQWPESLS